MKNLFIHFAQLVFLFSSFVYSQSFTVDVSETEIYSDLGSEIIFDFEITNVTANDLSLYFLRSANNLPEEWSSSLCFEYCFAPHLDSIATNSQFGSTPIKSGEKREFSVHVFPLTNDGSANIGIKIGNSDNPSEFYEYSLLAGTNVTSVLDNEINTNFELHQNYPNPFNPSTTIIFNIEKNGFGKLEIFDVIGNKVETIKEGNFSKGYHEYLFEPKNYSSGIYFYKLSINKKTQVKKMILSK
ncbi:MAG: T9SS type A sorting domain-containing protein [Ignavibacteriae bacterium]|nr:T9SS type A sorting domain-containing protein [Ignavibacteriota bacterium]